MENVGEWNMALGFWFASLVALPIVLKICVWIFDTVRLPEIHVVTVEKPVYKRNTVYVDRVVEKTVYKDPNAKLSKSSRKNESICPIHQSVIATLTSLGCKKKDAKTLVASLATKKNYEDDESLLKDCLAKL